MDDVFETLRKEEKVSAEKFDELQNERYRLIQQLRECDKQMEKQREDVLQLRTTIKFLEERN